MDEKKHLEERLEYLEGYWEDLENDHERRERAIEWMKELPKGRDGVVQFLNGVTSDYCKAFILSITVHSPLNYTVHWYDDTRTEVVMYSNIEDYRYTASYFDGQAMRDNCYRKKYVKERVRKNVRGFTIDKGSGGSKGCSGKAEGVKGGSLLQSVHRFR